MTLRSGMPRPPKSLGAQTNGQATLHFPPFMTSLPDHKKARRHLSISEIAQADRQQVIEMCTGIADSVVWVRVVRPAVFIIAPFQAGILEATLSTKRCSSTRFSLDNDNGAPKYVHGNCCSWQGNTCWTSATSSSEHRIGVILHLSRLV